MDDSGIIFEKVSESGARVNGEKNETPIKISQLRPFLPTEIYAKSPYQLSEQ